jgi:hypothetical protein
MSDLTRIATNTIQPNSGTWVRDGFINDNEDIENIYVILNKLRGMYVGTIAPTSPNTGDLWRDSATTPNVIKEWNGSAWEVFNFDATNIADAVNIITAPMANFKNKIINARNIYSQRGSSFALASGSAGYTLDRYYVHNDTNQSVTITPYAYNSWTKSLRIYRTSTNPTTGNVTVHHCIECAKTLSTEDRGVGKATLYIEVDGYDVTASLVQSFGTGGSPSSDVTTSFTLTKTSLGGSVNKFVGSVDVPSVSAKTFGTDGNDYLELVITIPLRSTACNILFTQLEEGSVFTSAEKLAPGVDLRNCQRYYEKSYDINVAPGTVTTSGEAYSYGSLAGSISKTQRLMAPKRNSSSTITVRNRSGTANSVTTISSGGALTNRTPTISAITESSFSVSATTTDVGLVFQYEVENEL